MTNAISRAGAGKFARMIKLLRKHDHAASCAGPLSRLQQGKRTSREGFEMKALISGAAMMAALALGSAPAAASEAPGFASWLAQAVDARMFHPAAPMGRELSGIAVVAFDTGPGNEAANARIAESSGIAALDQAALRTVASLGRLPDSAPSGTHLVVLQYGVADDNRQIARRQHELGLALANASRSYASLVRDSGQRLATRAGGGGTVISTIQ